MRLLSDRFVAAATSENIAPAGIGTRHSGATHQGRLAANGPLAALRHEGVQLVVVPEAALLITIRRSLSLQVTYARAHWY